MKNDKIPRTGKRRLSELADHHLWAKVTRTVTPIAPTAPIARDPAAAAGQDRPQSSPAAIRPAELAPASSPAALAGAAPAAPALRLTGLDRRTRQKLTRGKVDIDARVDLHGLGAEQARIRLRRFLLASRAEGAVTVLVITGKGPSPYARHTLHGASDYHVPERRGLLRRLVPAWLEETEFAEMVAGYQPAHPRHGGGGAYYVRLRRKRRSGAGR